MPSSAIRVLVADDSPTVRHHLANIIDAAPVFEVVGMASNGQLALEMVEDLQPDVVSMDVNMPVMDGLEATRHIMRTVPTPVVIVSGLLEREIDLSFRALQAGALAVVAKPPARHDDAFPQHQHQLLNTLQAMAGVRVIRRWASVYQVPRYEPRTYETRKLRPAPSLIAVAASAGGPSALATLLAGIRNQLSVPMVLVQHMPGEFLEGLARWLGKYTDLPVNIAQDRQLLMPGMVHLAPGHAHLRVYRQEDRFVAILDTDPGPYRYQPAADVLFESVATACGNQGVGIVMTGMGDDGAAGLLKMRRAGARTFAQDAESATVFGMPGAAIEQGAAERVQSPAQLAASLRKLM